MHAVFYVMGKKEYVDRFLKWLETRMFFLPVKNPDMNPDLSDKDGNVLKEGFMPIEGVLRYGVMGTWEYIFPEESKNKVLTTLNFQKHPNRAFNKTSMFDNFKVNAKVKALSKALGLEKIPKFNEEHMFLPSDLKQHLSIIPLGVRYDEKEHKFDNGLVHEAL